MADRIRSYVPSGKVHDHGDTRVFGWTVSMWQGPQPNPTLGDLVTRTHREPVPGWWFVCPTCGDPIAAALCCDVWSPDGARWRRVHQHLWPGQMEVLSEDSEEGEAAAGTF